jgi:hypothetical protein
VDPNRALRTAGNPSGPPPFPDVPSVRETIVAASRQPQWVAKPFYNADLVFRGNDGWVWDISGLSGRDRIPWIRPRDGKMYPFESPRARS